jgi:hypothetical protein
MDSVLARSVRALVANRRQQCSNRINKCVAVCEKFVSTCDLHFLCRSYSVQPGINNQSIAAIQLGNGAGVTVSGMGLSLSKSLPSLGHLNQKSLLPRINGCASVLQAPHSVSLAVFCDRHASSP